MCGICGMFDMNNENRISTSILKAMNDKLQHRGPDNTGIEILGNMGMGFTRLSIIDLEGGMQPISNEDDTITVVCNGEIYNYKELGKYLNFGNLYFFKNQRLSHLSFIP